MNKEGYLTREFVVFMLDREREVAVYSIKG